MYGREKNINIIFFLLLSSLAVGQNTLPMNADTVFAKKNLKVGRGLFLDDYKNLNINVPEYQIFNPTINSYNDIHSEVTATESCDASALTTFSNISTINGSTQNYSSLNCDILGSDTWEVSLNYPIDYLMCPEGYISNIIVRTVGVSNNGSIGYGSGLKIDGINTTNSGQYFAFPGISNAPFEYYFVDTTDRTSLTSIIATFFFENSADVDLDGMEVILQTVGCEDKYLFLTTNSRGTVLLDTLPPFVTLDDLPAPENFANTDLTFTDNRLHNGNGNDLEITNLNNSTISANNSIENIGVSKTIQAQDNIILSSTNGNGSNVTTIQSNGTLNQITDNTTGYTLSHTEGGQQVAYNYTNIPNTISNFTITPERGNVHYNLESGLSGGIEYETIQTIDTTILLEVKNSDNIYSSLRIEPNSFELRTKSNQNTPTSTPGQVLTLIDEYTGECDWADATGGTGINIYNSDGTLSTDRNIYGADNSLYINSLVDLTMQGNGAFNIINNNTDQSSAPAINIEGNSFSSGGNAEGVRISGSSDNSLAVNIIGNSSTTTDIQILPQNGRLVIDNLSIDNTADQLMGKDASGYSVWVDKSSISGSSTIDTIILQGSIDTLVLNSAVDTVSVTYTQFYNTITNNNLQIGKTYIIMDFQTVYDQMDFDAGGSLKPTLVTKTGSIEQIWVLALAPNQIASQAYSATYPNDQIKYDWTYNVTPQGAAAKGRISERVDENNNRTDYDHREIKFIRYDDGVGNFIQIRDSGRASGEFLTFVQNFTGGNVKENWLGDFYSIGVSVGQEYPNNIFKGGQIWSNTSSAVFYNNTFSSVVYSNTFKGDVYSNTFKGDVYHNTFRGAIYKNTFSNYVTMNTFDIIVANNLFNDEVFRNKFSSSIANNKFTYTGSLQNTTIEGVLINKTITNVTYPFLFNTDYKKEILKASNGNTYIRYFDGTADVNTLIP